MAQQKQIILTRHQHQGMDIIKIGFEYDTRIIAEVKKIAGVRWSQSLKAWSIEQGIDLRYIQEWLWNESSKTTGIYTHVKNTDFMKFKNPLDDLFEDDS